MNPNLGPIKRNVPTIRILLILIVGLLIPKSTFSQYHNLPFATTQEEGIPYIQHYGPKEYHAHYQNWDMVQDKNGLIYIANGDGILEYDGVSWRAMSLPGFTVMRSLAIDQENRVYFGSSGDLGYLAPDSIGEMQLVSLKEYIPREEQDFADVWNTFVLDNGVLFHTYNKLLLWRDDQFTVINLGEVSARGWKIKNDIYFHIAGKGLTKWSDDSIKLVSDGHKFDRVTIQAMLPFDNGQALICTTPDGLYSYDGTEATKIQSDVNPYLVKSRVYKGLRLPSGIYALGTIQNGIVFIDQEGRLVSQIAKDQGLGDNIVLSLDLDQQNGLWAGTFNGLSRIEVMSPYRVWDDRNGLEGRVFAITRHRGRLNVATSLGVYYLQYKRTEPGTYLFNRYPNIRSHCWAILPFGESLLAAASDGVYDIQGNEVKKINSYTADALFRSRIDSNRVYIGIVGGLSSIYFTNGTWINEGKVEGIGEEIRAISESKNGKLWLGTLVEGLLRVEFPQLSSGIASNLALRNPIVKRYNTEHGLPEGWARIYTIEGKEYFRTDLEISKYSVYQFDQKNERFYSDSTFGDRFGAPKKNVFPVSNQDANGFVWMRMKLKDSNKTPRILAKKGKDGIFTAQYFYEERFTKKVVRATYLDDSIAWFGGEGLVQYDLSSPFNPSEKFNAFVRSVNTINDSIIYRGNTTPENNPTLSYTQNTLRLEFAATSFEQEALNQYQYQLNGFDKDWSDWTLETKKDYTNLNDGTYTFKVRAKNIYGTISREGSFSFQIIPPWFKTWWAYLIYIVVFGGFIMALVRWRSHQLIMEKENLEKIINERTKEVKKQAKQLKIQKEKLQQLDQTKSRFFANISHEFRTPLTLILGTLEDKISQKLSSRDQQDFGTMQRHARRLQRLINQLLDLSKLEAGNMKLEITSQDIYAFLNAIISSFNSHAHQRQINFNVQIPAEFMHAYFDQDKIEKIVYNLLSNAFKFTPDGGEIMVKSSSDGKNISLSIQDSGPGIPENQLRHIFDRFYQADDSFTRENEGTGIGLALTKELVELHLGKIYAESKPNVGSTFTLHFPIQANEYDAFDIVHETTEIIANKDGTEQTTATTYDDASQSSQASTLEEDVPVLLIIEDNKDLRNYIRKHLKGFRILEAENGLTGLQKAQEYIPDLVVSDVMMPKMDGVTLLHHLKTDQKTSHIPVILLTAKADTDSKIEGLQTGADDYLTKPFNAQELKARISNLIDQRNKLRALFSTRITLEPREIAITGTDEQFIKRVLDLVEQNMDNSDFDVEAFQKEVGMSRMQLHRKLKALTGCSSSEFIRVQRLKRAAQMLEAKVDNISQIAYQTGFNNLSYFAKCFKEQFGVSPSAYMHHKPSTLPDS